MDHIKAVEIDRPADTPNRQVGIEIEFAGLEEDRVAQIVAELWGGEISTDGPFKRQVTGGRLGDVKIELDTAYRNELSRVPEMVGNLAHQLIPCEIVTDPIAESDMGEVDHLVETLREAGAEGTRSALVNGFGVHFNPAQTDLSAKAILPIMQSWAVLEPWLRHYEPMGITRRALPFTAPWPEALRERLFSLDPDDAEIGQVIDLYLSLAPSRNFGLDMLPLFRHIDEERVMKKLGADAPSARPTWHFRLPSCRIDEQGWTISGEWEKWLIVEALAAMPRLLARTGRDWSMNFNGRFRSESAWVERLDGVLGAQKARGTA